MWMAVVSGLASQDLPVVTGKYYFKDAFVVDRAGGAPTISSVLVVDGIIHAVGKTTPIPYDAKLIDSDSLYIYPGFIAAFSQAGVDMPKEDPSVRPSSVGKPENEIAGIVPERSLASLYKADHGSIASQREQGFTIAHIVPDGNMLPGMGSIVALDGNSFSNATMAKDVSQFLQLKGSGRMFPSTIIAVMTKWREMYRQAELDMAHQKAYALNPIGKQHPKSEPAIEALFPVVRKEKSVYFLASDELSVHRALALQKEMGFKMILAEAKSIKGAEKKLMASQSPILVSLDLPATMKEEDGKDEKADETLKKLQKRKAEAIKDAEGFASQLAGNSIPFAFSLKNVKPKDILPNIRRMINAGLSEQAALAALTVNAARILNIEKQAGSIEKGKTANLVVSTAPIFDDKAKIKMVVVNGKIFEYDVKEKKKSETNGPAADIAGEWKYSIDVPGMTPTGSIIVTKVDDKYKLSITSDMTQGDAVETSDVTLDGNDLSFSWNINAGGMNASLSADVTVDGDSFSGTVDVGEFGSFPIKGSRTPQ